ncbi:hypothetical protein SAMN05421734_101267 [Pelagirhabdus alkalitolerans]|uniref:Uncharacterized protein n=1 Tax=Pelagirhabdus alkalitolerans TaxID=1612202 RepID=A0A1G6GM46_9BACI|nr:hypothetical protein SAMN05421734_101267 [Pelagirhabdus alkalitolerans]
MLKKRWFKHQMLELMVITDQADKSVKHIRFPKFFIWLILILFISSATLFTIQYSTNQQLARSNELLEMKMDDKSASESELLNEIEELTDERDRVLERNETLEAIETKIYDSLDALPEEALGGVDIPLDNASQDLTEQEIIETSEWVIVIIR